MQIRQGNVLQALRGVQVFLDAHADVLGPEVTSGARRKLDAQVAMLDPRVQAQGTSAGFQASWGMQPGSPIVSGGVAYGFNAGVFAPTDGFQGVFSGRSIPVPP